MNIIQALESLVSGKLNIIRTLMVMMKLEARLAGQSILPLLLNVCMILGILITFWILTLSLIGYFLMMYVHNLLHVLLMIWGFNVIVLIVLYKSMQFNLNNMSFERTRRFFSKKEQGA